MMNARKRFITIFTVFLTISAVNAQISKDALKVLDRCAKTFKSAGNVKIQFEATQFMGKEEIGSSKGNISISGKKLFIENEGFLIWFDGKTQWSYVAENNEVNITEPSSAERSMMNPYSFLSIYKKGYRGSMTSEVVRGESCYCVTLISTGITKIQTILLTISKKTLLPICIRTKSESNKWTRISIYDLKKNQYFKDEIFQFNSKDFPKVEIVDLR